MSSKKEKTTRKRILLSGVFGPYGVDDSFGRKENIMELFHNQVTKAQGIASLRFFHRSFGLYFLAANVDADVTVLDFPSKRRFRRELKKGYDIVGISFITPNFSKAQEMARMVRALAPASKIILGGHGTAIQGVESSIPCDGVARGEGVRWLREYLGQDPDAPIFHPVLPSTERRQVFGVPIPGATAGLLVPGVGCVNGCKFCSTSHYFGKRYSSFLSTGQELFDTACRIADQTGSDSLFIMDENFLKDRARALELLNLMETHQRFFDFSVFSSAETIMSFGLDNLVRLGVTWVWIGVESSNEDGNFEKNRGIDPAWLISELRARGISVLASGILCQEHHTPQTIGHEIDFMVGLQADMVQFMLLSSLPVTGLYKEHQERGMLRQDLPFEEWHGQKELTWQHPSFGPGEPARWLDEGFRRDHVVNSSSILRFIDTALRGYRTLSAMPNRDACLENRLAERTERVKMIGLLLPVIARYAINPTERERARELDRGIRAELGPWRISERIKRVGARLLATRWRLRAKLRGDRIQPKTLVTHFQAGQPV